MMFPVLSSDVSSVEVKAANWTWNSEYSEQGYKKVPVSNLTGSADSYDTSGEDNSTGGAEQKGHCANAVDGVTSSYWHTNYNRVNEATTSDGVLNKNNTYTITLTEAVDVAGVTVLPRQDQYANGAIIQGDVLVSTTESGDDWTTAVTDFKISAHGTTAKWNADKGEKEIIFETKQQDVKRIQFVIERTGVSEGTDYTDSGTSRFITAAEFSVLTTEKINFDVYAVSAGIVDGCAGMGTVAVSNANVEEGESVTFTATPKVGYRFVKWQTVDGTLVSRDATITITPTADATYYAVFQGGETFAVNVATKEDVQISLSDGTTVESEGAGQLAELVNGTKTNFVGYVNRDSNNNEAYVQLDLGKVYSNLDCVKLFRYYYADGGTRKYGATIIVLSEDENFSNPTVIYNSNQGKDGYNQDMSWNPMIGEFALGTGTESLYFESVNGKEFTIPAGTKAQYVRIYTAGANSHAADNVTQHIYEIEVWANEEGIVPRTEITATVGSVQNPNATSGDAGANAAIDGNTGSWWHSNWSSHSGKMNLFWIDLEFNNLTTVDGIRALPRDGQKNGVITGYEVWVSEKDEVTAQTGENDTSWKNDYVKVCSGTWLANGNGTNVWKSAKFEAIDAKHVRLVVTSSAGDSSLTEDNRYASLVEMRVTTPTTTDGFFTGGALRMDLPYDYTKTFLRFMYQIPATFNGMNIDTDNMWGWRYSVVSAADVENKTVTPVATNKYELDEKNGVYKSNIVFKNIGELNYDKPVYTQLVVNYKNASNETLKVYAPVSKRSVKQVAEAIVDAYTDESGNVTEGKGEQVTYANGILAHVVANAQLAANANDATFSGNVIDLEDCLYTFEATTGESTTANNSAFYYISTKVSNTDMYLRPESKGNSSNKTAVEVIESGNKFKFKNNGFHLHFYDNNLNNLYYDRCTGDTCTGHNFEIYKLGYSDESSIAGYTRITSLTELNDGDKYFIAIIADDNNFYVLHPANTTNARDHVAKVVQ